MGAAIGQVLPLAVGVSLSPMPIVAVVLMLVSARARANGPAFVLGWIVGIAVVGTIVLLIAGPSGAEDEGQPATWVNVLKLVLGVALVLLAAREWRGRPAGAAEAATPKWMGAIDDFSPAKAAVVGVALSAANPKNLLFVVGAATAVAQTGISASDQAVVWAIFTLVGTVGVAAPVAVYFALGDRAPALLERLKGWMVQNNQAVMAVLCLVIGAKLIGDSISGFSG